ncbi:zinc transporter ZIP9-like isoform X1 [Hemiscyllium ocellatum]|uniref:zinc transporter ZIP9-like isoform X1 n=1 Tax=Hemiscyllium ocellatum TaxID=170820 RepID=UPI002966C8E1|nr:zinc transporter ZIP9-like isoform X1 [Hemiscyllium ocellatum]
MDGAITIILLSLAMFGGCLLLGMIPLTIRLPQEKLKFVTVLGAGLLCGTALAIIIPEGIELLLGDLTTDQQRNISQKQVIMEYKVSDGKQAGTKEFAPPHFVIGISLVMGFLLMFIIDQIGNCITWQGGESPNACQQVSDGQQSSPSQHPASNTQPVASTITETSSGPAAGSSLTATLGLVIHAAADGVALGTAAGSSQISLQVIVFFAVILHKAPASFGLVSYLMYAGLEKKQIQKHLFIFSLAAPLLAITTYFIVSKSSVGSLHQTKATGIGLLFSAGTFLYVASVHVLPEVSSQTQHRVASNGGRKGLGILESLTLIVGCTIPVLLSLGLHDA